MKIELKAIKYSAFASQETHCYEANLYVDGKKIGVVSNDGHGGADSFWGSQEDRNRVEAWLKENGNHSTYSDGSIMHEDLEMRCSRLMNDWHRDQELKKILRRVSYIVGNEVYQLPSKYKPTPELLERIKTDWADKEYTMLSGLPVAEARAKLDDINFFGGEQ